jgi:PAS domain S-box-containing protein
MDSGAAALRTVDHLSALVAYWDLDQRCVFANAAYSQRLGMGPKEMIGMSIAEFLGPKYEFSRPFILRALAGERQTFEQPIRRAGGGVMDALVTYAPDFADDGSVVGFTAHITDVSILRDRESALAQALAQVQRHSRIYRALGNCSAAIMHCATEAQLFAEVCRVAVADGGMKLAWIGTVDAASQELRPLAASGEPSDYVSSIKISLRSGDVTGTGPTGTAVRECRPIYCQDFLADASTKPWRDGATRAGLAASASLPLYRNGAAIGALTLYAAEREAFDDDIQRLLVAIAADISLALDNFARAVALAASEASYRALVEWSPEPMLVIRDAVVSYANPAAIELFGASSAHDLVGKPVLDRVHPDDRPIAVARLAQLAAGAAGTPRREYRYVTLDGTPIEVEVQSTVIEFDGAPAVHTLLRDVTARRKAEHDVRANQKLLDAIIDSAPSMIFALDLRHQFTLANDALARFYGMPKEDLIGKTLHDVFPTELADTLFAVNRRIMKTGEADSREEVVSNKSGDAPRVLITSKFPLRDEWGQVSGLAGVATDVTAHRISEAERTSLAAQLQQAQKMESVGRLAGGVAHDFNNMLGVILGHAELALMQLDPSQPLHADLLDIRHAAERSTELTRQLLTFARQEVVAPKVLDLNETVTNELRMLQRLIGEDITINWQSAAGLWPIRVDPSQIDQILINLCVNARDAIADVGTITLATANVQVDAYHPATHAGASPGDYVHLSVRDDGCGMTEATLAHIFEPFFTTKDVGEGTGLGLATVYGAVQQNGGAVTVTSARGRGTTFDIYLPRHAGPAKQADSDRAPAPVARGSETILLVEDEPKILKLAATVLESAGYTVLRANSPSEAIRLASGHVGTIHLVLSDVIMPDMNGRDLARRLVALHPTLKRVFMSGHPAGVIASRGMLEQGVHFIPKPFSIAELTAKVRAVLDTE